MKKKTPSTTKSVVISQVSLAPRQVQTLQQSTPAMYIRERPVRGGKKAKYVEVGYVISQLNAVFGAPNWEFEVLEQGQTDRKNENNTDGEVWVRGKITIIDHKNGYRVSKTQYGQHNIHKNVPIGDAFKAASSDSLKKAASLLGIGLDVMWGQLEATHTDSSKNQSDKPEMTSDEMFEVAKKMILSCKNPSQLIVIDEKIQGSKKYTKAQKEILHASISSQIDKANS